MVNKKICHNTFAENHWKAMMTKEKPKLRVYNVIEFNCDGITVLGEVSFYKNCFI